MKPPAVSLLLGVSVLLLSGLTVSAVSLNLNLSPNLQQFFSGDSVSLSCVEDGQTGGGWTVKRTVQGSSQQCGLGHDFGNVVGSSCDLSPVSPSDSGLYWCEHTSGLSSDRISISVSDVILEIPALPVQTGSDVTLRCRNKQGSTVPAYFYRNGTIIETRSDTEFTISKVQQSDEGLYSCSPDLVQQSPQIWLRIKVTAVALGSLVLLVLVVLVAAVKLWRKRAGETQGSSAPQDVTYADVTISHTANRRDKPPADPGPVYSGLRTHAADKPPADPGPVYSGLRTHAAGPAEVTYGQVVIRAQRKTGRRPEQSADPDVVYSSVRPGL